MIWRPAKSSELFREFAAFVIRNSAIDFHPHKIADLLDEIEVQRERGGPWTVFALDRLEAEAERFDDADPLSDFADVPVEEICRDVPVDSVISGEIAGTQNDLTIRKTDRGSFVRLLTICVQGRPHRG